MDVIVFISKSYIKIHFETKNLISFHAADIALVTLALLWLKNSQNPCDIHQICNDEQVTQEFFF